MNKTKLVPLGHRILLKLDRELDKKESESVIALLKSTEDTRNREILSRGVGTVVAIGETAFMGYADDRPWFGVGDRIHYLRHVGTVVDDYTDEEGHKYRCINDVDAFLKEVEIDE